MLDSPVDEIKSKVDIVELLKEYIQLKKAGANYKGLCPFHNEKTPSFMVSEEKQIWHCFGCGEGGDIFGFIMKMEGLEFPEALRLLAGKAGVVLRKQNPAIASKKNTLLDINRLATKFFHKVLRESEAGKKAMKYLLDDRKLSEETIDDFLIGFAPESWDTLLNFLKKKGYNEEEIFLAGLVVKKEKGVGYYDRFRNRIMFPITEVHGNVVGFTARVMPGASEKEGGKYINTPQTMLFDKSRLLFGLERAKQEIKKQDLVVMVEGQLDVISSHQAGITNVVASSGTSLTENHARLIKRYSKNIAMAFDMDDAGEAAALRGVETALAGGLNIRVIELPKDKKGEPIYKDPDECIQKDIKLWEQSISEAKPFMDYLMDITFTRHDLKKIDEKKKATYHVLKYIGLITDKLEQSHYIKKLAEAINESEEILIELVGTPKPQKTVQAEDNEPKEWQVPAKRENIISDRLLSISIKEPRFFNYIIENLPTEMVPGEKAKNVYKKLIIQYTDRSSDIVDESFEFDYNEVKKSLEPPEAKYFDSLILLGEDAFYEQEIDLLEAELKNLTLEAKKIAIARSLAEVQTKIKQAEKDEDTASLEELSQEFKLLLEQLNELHHS